MRRLGVDPGQKGALAILDDDVLIEVIDMPYDGDRVSAKLIADFLVGHSPERAIVERVASRPGMAAPSVFKFGLSYGIVLGVIGACELPLQLVTPSKWKGDLRLSKDKGQSRRLAQDEWPAHAQTFSRAMDDGRAEAALIALWAHRHA